MTINSLIQNYNSFSLHAKASLWYIVCNVLNKGVALLTTPIFTRFLTEEEFGEFTLFQSWYAILVIFTSLNVFLAGYQKGLILFKNDILSFTSSQLGLTTFITIFFFVIYLLFYNFWQGIFNLAVPLMIAMFLELLTMPAVELWAARLRFDFKYKSYVYLTIAMSLVSTAVAVIAVIFCKYKIEARVFSDVGVKFLFSGVIFIFIFFKGKKFFSSKYWKYSLIFNLPLIPHYISHFILNQSDRIMIGYFESKVQVAYYGLAYTLSMVMLFVINGINNSFCPTVYKFINSDNYNFEKINSDACWYTLLVFVLCLVTMIIAPELIYIFAGNKYMAAVYIVPPVSASVFFIFLYSLYSNIEYYYQKTIGISAATFLSAILNVILNYIFIKKYGYYAAAYTTLFCYLLLSFIHFVFFKRLAVKHNLIRIYNIKFQLSLCVILIICVFLFTLIYNHTIIRYLLLFFGLIYISYYINKLYHKKYSRS